MLSLKRITIAVGGLIAAVFGGGFFGVQVASTPVESSDGLHRDLQVKSAASMPALGAQRESKPNAKLPDSKPDFASADFAGWDRAGVSFEIVPELVPGMPDRPHDWRRSLLVGVVELRI